MSPHLPIWYALAGLVLGLFDLALLTALGVETRWHDTDLSLAVGLFYGGTYAVLGAVIGRLRLAHRALAETQQQLVAAEKLAALGQLAAGVAHEVRNPLGVLRASASYVLEEPDLGPEVRRSATFIRDEVDRLDHLVARLLDFSRPLTPDRTTVAPAALVAQALALAAGALDGRTARVEGDGPAVPLDLDLLTQALLGLVVNAAQSADQVVVRIRPQPGGLALEVADDGPGVTPADAGRIFEPFFTTRAQGTGLGLPMAARIAEAHGGALTLIPGAGLGPQGQGACFRLQVAT